MITKPKFRRAKQLLFTFAMLLCAAGANAQTSWDIGYPTATAVTATYDTQTKTLTISGEGEMKNYAGGDAPWRSSYQSAIETVVIEDGVTNVSNSALYYLPNLTSVSFGKDVKSIKMRAFQSCISLSTIVLPESLTTIGSQVFIDCPLITLHIPKNVNSIEDGLFDGCETIESITVDGGNNHYSAEDGILFNKDQSTIVAYPTNKVGTSYEVPATVTTIEENAFYQCKNLTAVTLPKSVTSIGSYAFSKCTNLTTLDIKGTITSVGNSAFYGTALIKAQKDDEAVYVGNILYEYYGSSSDKYEVKEGTVTIADEAFYECTTLTSITLPASVTSIGSYAFNGCTNLATIEIKGTITSVGSSAFYGTPWLKNQGGGAIYIDNVLYCYNQTSSDKYSVVVKDGTTAIAGGAFAAYDMPSGLTDIIIPASVTSIGDWAFEYLPNLKTVTLMHAEPTAIEMGKYAFNGTDTEACTLVVPAGSRDAYANAYTWGDFNIVSIETWEIGAASAEDVVAEYHPITQTLTISGEGKMKDFDLEENMAPWITNGYAPEIKAVVIEEGVTNVGANAFTQDDNLTSVTIPESVNAIGMRAFAFCGNLKTITLMQPDPKKIVMGENVFELVNTKACALMVPSGSQADYAAADQWKEFNIASFETWAVGAANAEDVVAEYNPITQTLTVSGEGAMMDFDAKTNIAPWIEEYAYDIKAVVIEEGVTNVGDGAFVATALSSVTISSTVETIGSYAFALSENLTSVTIPATVESIGDYAFAACGLQRVIAMAYDAESIAMGEGVFAGVNTVYCALFVYEDCYESYANAAQWKDFYINEAGIWEIGAENASDVVAIYNIKRNNLIISGNGAMMDFEPLFYPGANIAPWLMIDVTDFNSVVIEEGVTNVGDGAFVECFINSVTIAASVETIGEEAFYAEINSLVVLQHNPAEISFDEWAFAGETISYAMFVVPSGSGEAYRSYEPCSYFSSIIEIPTFTPSKTDVEVTWEGNEDIAFYIIEVLDMNGSSVASFDINSSTTMPYTVESLTMGTNYKYMVEAYGGETPFPLWSYSGTFTTRGASTPVITKINNITDNSATISWRAGTDDVSWNVIISETEIDDFDAVAATDINTVDATTYAASGLTKETEYFVYVQSVDADGDKSDWAKNEFTTIGDGLAIEKVETPSQTATIVGYYSLTGMRLEQAPARGIYIVKYSDGSSLIKN